MGVKFGTYKVGVQGRELQLGAKCRGLGWGHGLVLGSGVSVKGPFVKHWHCPSRGPWKKSRHTEQSTVFQVEKCEPVWYPVWGPEWDAAVLPVAGASASFRSVSFAAVAPGCLKGLSAGTCCHANLRKKRAQVKIGPLECRTGSFAGLLMCTSLAQLGEKPHPTPYCCL